MVGVFIFIMGSIIIPWLNEILISKTFLLGGGLMLLFLGIALMIKASKEEINTALKKFLILTGASAVGFFVSVVMHNLFYALSVLVNDYKPLLYVTETLHVVFFLFAIIVCPIGFLIGTIKTCFLLRKLSKETRKI